MTNLKFDSRILRVNHKGEAMSCTVHLKGRNQSENNRCVQGCPHKGNHKRCTELLYERAGGAHFHLPDGKRQIQVLHQDGKTVFFLQSIIEREEIGPLEMCETGHFLNGSIMPGVDITHVGIKEVSSSNCPHCKALQEEATFRKNFKAATT